MEVVQQNGPGKEMWGLNNEASGTAQLSMCYVIMFSVALWLLNIFNHFDYLLAILC